MIFRHVRFQVSLWKTCLDNCSYPGSSEVLKHVPNWKDASGDTNGDGKQTCVVLVFCHFADFIQQLVCFGNSSLQNPVRQPSRHPDISSSKQIHIVFGNEAFSTNIFRSRKTDGLEILIWKNLWTSEILGGKQVLWECLSYLSYNVSIWDIFLEMAHIQVLNWIRP